MATRMQQRRGTAATWTSANPILAAGEIGFEIDTNKFKIGDGSSRWDTLTYFTADAAAAIQDLIDGAPGVLDTLNELAAAVNDDPNFFATVATNLSNHEADTSNVHGIADTTLLETISGAQDKADAAQSAAEATASAALASAVSDLEDDLNLKAPLASPTFTGTVVLPTTTAGGNIVPSADNTYDLGSPSAMWKDIYVGPGSLYVNGQKVLQDESGNIVISADANENLSLRTSGSGNLELDATGTGNVQIKSALVIEGGSNITSSDGNAIVFGNAINTDTISSKTTNTDLSLSANGTGKVYLNDNAEVNGNLVIGGNLTVSGTTTTVNSETISLADNLIDLNSNFTSGNPTENAGIKVKRGDSSDVQLRWNESSDVWEFTNDGVNYSSITPLNSPTFTGTVSGITKSMVGLGNVDNTSDTDKPISTATQSALDLKAPLASPDLTGIPTAPTAALGTNTTQVATTAFVDAAIEALAGRNLVLDGGGV